MHRDVIDIRNGAETLTLSRFAALKHRRAGGAGDADRALRRARSDPRAMADIRQFLALHALVPFAHVLTDDEVLRIADAALASGALEARVTVDQKQYRPTGPAQTPAPPPPSPAGPPVVRYQKRPEPSQAAAPSAPAEKFKLQPAPASAVEQPPPADPCAAPWQKVNEEVAKIDAMTDVRERNRAISASYARLYQASPDLKWAGAAAFASKQVGCGMDTAHTYLDDYPGGIEGAVRDLSSSGVGIDPITLTMYDARQTLAGGNVAVYDELYPALRFYQQNKESLSDDQIITCLGHRPATGQQPAPPLDPMIVRGLKQIMAGDPNAGALTMLRHEQFDTLQVVAYDKSWLFRRSLDISRFTGYPPITFVVSAACSSENSSQVVNFRDFGGALYDPDKRWPFAQECANRFIELAESPETGNTVTQALKEIANGAGSP